MKTLFLAAVLLVSSSSAALAEDCPTPAKKHSKEFDRLSALEGRWEGRSMMNGKEGDVTVVYDVTSNGTAIVETLFPGTPHEMVSMYYDNGPKLEMTHYCALGNQPRMGLTKSTPEEIVLEFSKNNAIDPKKEDHMNLVRFRFIDNDTLVQNWSGVHEGRIGEPTVLKLSRVR